MEIQTRLTATEFVTWLKGFVAAANNFTVTPKQWDDIKEKLSTVAIKTTDAKLSRYTLDHSATTTAKVLLTDNTES